MNKKAVIKTAFEVIKTLKKSIIENKKIDIDIPDVVRRKEFATIKMSFPRRMGNTTLALYCLKYFKNSILYAGNQTARIDLISKNPRFRDRILIPVKYIPGLSMTKVVIVDQVSTTPQVILDKIYGLHAADAFILIG